VKKKSCSAQTNGGLGGGGGSLQHRKLVKSTSEMGQFEDIQMKIYDLDTGLVRSREFILPPPLDFDPAPAAAHHHQSLVLDDDVYYDDDEEGGLDDEDEFDEDDEDDVGTGHREYREIKRLKEYQEIFIDFQPTTSSFGVQPRRRGERGDQQQGLPTSLKSRDNRPVIPLETEYYLRNARPNQRQVGHHSSRNQSVSVSYLMYIIWCHTCKAEHNTNTHKKFKKKDK
jgi:hypothetical protein